MRRIAAQITGMDGFVDEKNIANGAYGGWTSQPRDFGLDCRHGHIAIALSSEILGSVLQESDRLYRFKVKHKPELNRMYTYIDMGGNNLNNTNAVNAKNGHYSEEINTGGNIKTQGGWMITQHGKGWLNEAHGGGFYMDDNDWIRSVNNKGIYTGGQLKGGTVRADGRLFTGEFLQLDGTAQPSWGCNPNGLVGRTPEGALLYVKMDCGRRDLRCNNMNVNKWVTGVAVTSENIVAPLIGMLLVSNLWVINTKSRPTLLPAVSEVGHDWRGINGTVPLKNSGGPAQGNSAVD